MPEFNPDKHYYGKPCKYGHDGMRYRKTRECVACHTERVVSWGRRNPEKVRAASKRWKKHNPDKASESRGKGAVRNLEASRQRARRWRINNPERSRMQERERTSRRESLKLNATPAWADHDEIRYVYSLAAEKGLVVDHIVPLKSDYVCGLHCADNLRCISQKLNQHKGNRYWPSMPDD